MDIVVIKPQKFSPQAPAFTEASRSVDIRYQAIRQDCTECNSKVGGVCSSKNPSDVLSKPLYPHPHLHHSRLLIPKTQPYYNEEYLAPQQLKAKIANEEAPAQKLAHKLATTGTTMKQLMQRLKTDQSISSQKINQNLTTLF